MGKLIERYKDYSIYDKGEKAKTRYRFYARDRVNYGYEHNPIIANGNSIQSIKEQINNLL